MMHLIDHLWTISNLNITDRGLLHGKGAELNIMFDSSIKVINTLYLVSCRSRPFHTIYWPNVLDKVQATYMFTMAPRRFCNV